MIDLTQPQLTVNISSGRHPKSPEMTAPQIKQEAQRILMRGISARSWHVIDLLATGGVLSLTQLGTGLRTLQRMTQIHILDRLPYAGNDLGKALADCGLPDTSANVFLYTLGLVGIEIAKMRHGYPPPTGYLGYTLQRTLHDVVLNEIVLRLARYVESLGWAVKWLSHYEATLSKDGSPILEPDALLVLRKDNTEKYLLVEYHNEDKQTRAHDKVRKYEAAFGFDGWRNQWDTDTFPLVLAVFKLPIVGQGYQNAINEREQVHCHYYGKALAGVIEGNWGEWQNINLGHREHILGEA